MISEYLVPDSLPTINIFDQNKVKKKRGLKRTNLYRSYGRRNSLLSMILKIFLMVGLVPYFQALSNFLITVGGKSTDNPIADVKEPTHPNRM